MKTKIFEPQRFEPKPLDGVVRNSWAVGTRRVTMTQSVDVSAGKLVLTPAEWAPDMPRKMSADEWRQYRSGRDAHYQQLANVLGGAVLSVE
jgi:hypothetical protein